MRDPIDRLRPSLTPHWIEPESIPNDADLAALHTSPLLGRILWQRGIRDADEARQFTSTTSSAAPSPWELPATAAPGRRGTL